MQRKWKRSWQRAIARAVVPPVAAGLLLLSVYSPASANPTGASVANGTATISTNGSTMTVNQLTNNAIINWQSFCIGRGETVNFIQPGSTSVALNRVLGNEASSIYGTLSANGRVYLINPNGILFAPGSQVNVGGLVASTLNISDNDFLVGKNVFANTGSAGSVINRGTITATDHVVLIGPQVKNEGVIAARVTGLTAGNKVSLDFSGDKLLNVTVDTSAAGASAANSGSINAAGGLVVMSTGTKDALLNTVVNNTGIIRAQSVSDVGGVIRLEGNTVTNSGTLDASGKASGQTGGTVKVLGDTVTLASGSHIDVSGDQGGGTALVGGARQGGAGEYAATTTTVNSGAIINADAITRGNGGQVVVWANDTTKFAGTITARGGSVSGNGGSVETSGKKSLKVEDSACVNTTAKSGRNGNWLLDPDDFTIGATGDIDAITLQNALATSDITITTTSSGSSLSDSSGTLLTGATGSGQGNIYVNDTIYWSSGGTLTLSAYNNIILNSSIIAFAGGLNLTANTSGAGNGATSGIISPAVGSSINADTFTLSGGTWREIGSLSFFYARDFRISGGTFVRALGGDGTSTASAYQITDVYGLQGIGSTGMLNKKYTLTNSIDAGGTVLWNSGAGFVPIGSSYSASFTGSFNGLGHTINALYINRGSTDNVGLFGYNYNATVQNVGLTNAQISGRSNVGSLVGFNLYSNIDNSYSTGNVSGNIDGSGNSITGGLVGNNNNGGNITNSHSTSTVIGIGTQVGGLAGWNGGGNISNSYSTGAVSGGNDVGGLVGCNISSISNSYSTGSVTGTGMFAGGLVGYTFDNSMITNAYSTGNVSGVSYVGGLAGFNRGTINNAYSTGTVTGSSGLGGLVAYNGGTVTNSYWDTQRSGQSSSAGGTGLTTAQMRTSAIFSAAGWDIATTGGSNAIWRIYDGQSDPLLRSFLTPLTVSADSVAMTYNGTVYSGALTGVTPYDSRMSGTLSYGSGTDAGTYGLGGLYSAGQNGYDVSYAPGSTLTITPRPITVTASDASRVYGDANPASGAVSLTSGSLVGTDALSSGASLSSSATSTSGVGGYSLTPFGVTFTSGNASNYAITYANGTLTITPRPITVTAVNANRMYGDANPASGVVNLTSGSLVGTDALGSAGLSSTATTTSSVGGYALTPSGVTFTSGSASNYSITYANGTLTITPRPITVTAVNASRVYGDASPASGVVNLTSGSLVGTDALGSAGLSSAATTTSGVGSYSLTPSGVTFTSGSASNYTITYASGTLTITPRPITVTAANTSRVYGDANPTSGVVNLTSGSLVGTDALGSAGLSSAATTTSGVGNYTLSPSGVAFTNGSASNYIITYANGTLTITPRALTVTADSATRTVGAANPVFTASYSGLANGDTASSLTGSLTFNTMATTSSPAGSYAIDLTGTLTSSNYIVSYVDGVLTVKATTNSGYTGAVGSAFQQATGGLTDGSFGGLGIVHQTGAANGFVPLTIAGSGINTSGYVPLNILGHSGQTDN